MFGKVAKKIFGSSNDRILRKLNKKVDAINALEATYQAMSDTQLRDQTSLFREKLRDGATLDTLLPDAFAVVREAAKRVLGQRPFDVQLLGGMVLHYGMIAEMRTGEGKTLVATLPSYLNALAEKGVHVVTVNDYLAKRDAEWMGAIHEFLGLRVGCIVHDMADEERREAYGADITYATNHELGFDYLRDNMKLRLQDKVLRDLNYAIVDEVDSILIDEARTPLIISGPTDETSDFYNLVQGVMHRLQPEDYEKDEKRRNVTLTEQGVENMEGYLQDAGLLEEGNLYDAQNTHLVHHVNQALKAATLFQRDTDYIVTDGQVKLIDEFTGRIMEGRRFSDGLHQALEAKEGVEVQVENQTLASITYQNFFKLYRKLSGMTGTAATEAAEFEEIYNLQTVIIPTNKAITRKDHNDEIYRTANEKDAAIISLIKECRERQQPVLVGTTSIEKSEKFSQKLKSLGIHHQVLNARFHEQEAQIIAEAGSPGAVTISTNMAGRGTDIKLGGNLERRLEKALDGITDEAEKDRITAEVSAHHATDEKKALEAGGLYVIGTERHESRRIDNQLRGRSGRQGDPGASKFFLSLQDDLMRIFGSEKLDSLLQRLGLQEGEAITHTMISRTLEKAQRRVEARNFDIRKQLLKYDNVMNDQRKAIYAQRAEVMQSEAAQEIFRAMQEQTIETLVNNAIPKGAYPEDWDTESLQAECKEIFNLDLPVVAWGKEEGIAEDEIKQRLEQATQALLEEKEKLYGSTIMRMAEQSIFLRVLDHVWKDHLLAMDQLREGINLRAYAQRDPLNEYKHEAYNLFEGMLDRLRIEVTRALCYLDLGTPRVEDVSLKEGEGLPETIQITSGGSPDTLHNAPQTAQDRYGNMPRGENQQNPYAGTRRNEPCPCGSGKKYKMCHGRFA